MKPGHILFRADASSDIGSGHVMRCLSLANMLKADGHDCVFASRFMPESIARLVESAGHRLERLDGGSTYSIDDQPILDHADWLGASQQEDADQCLRLSGRIRLSWVVVDHYALDVRWEAQIRRVCGHLMVIDDLGDRKHDCDLLLDQNLGADELKYAGKVPASCRLLIGPRYALLRPEFAEMRAYSLARRQKPQLSSLLIAMGGVDKNNVTSDILMALKRSPLPPDCRITVVMGSQSPWFADVQDLARSMPWLTDVRMHVSDMARLMAESDVAIGAAGGSAWERCCLGLPSLIVILADNQRQGAMALSSANAAVVLNPNEGEKPAESLPNEFSAMIEVGLTPMIENIAALGIDGLGTTHVATQMTRTSSPCPEFRLRSVEAADLALLLKWRNDSRVRGFMFSQEIISRQNHLSWYARVKDDPYMRLLLFETAAEPLGFVNFKIEETGIGASWGFYKNPDAPKGTGHLMGRAALEYAFRKLGLQTIYAEVLEGNNASTSMHQLLGFRRKAMRRDVYEIDGSSVNVICFALSHNEWLARIKEY